jgi:phosphoadenosine phosphosulfate reductase
MTAHMTAHTTAHTTPVLRSTDTLRELAERAGDELEGADALDVLRWADDHLGAGWCVTSSMADAVVAHLASRVRPGVDVLFLDTGYHFAETIGTRDAAAATLPVTVRTITPRQTVDQQDASFGARLYERNPDQCCALRKVTPLRQALKGYLGWASGLRRDEVTGRRGVRVVEWDARRSMIKLNPIASWTQDDVDRYIAEHGVLVNPLVYDGYGSIGCAPCTRRIRPGEDIRAGRWAGTSKSECGIHD